MNWPLTKRPAPTARKSAHIIKDSIRRKLSDYQPKAERSVFIGPALGSPDDHFEFEKVHIDPDSSGFHRIPFTC